MMLEPTDVVLYVVNLEKSSSFYQDLLGIKPEKKSPTFHSFKFSNRFGLGLKAQYSVEPPADHNGGGELAFTLHHRQAVDAVFATWQTKGINILIPPTVLTYGYTFVAQDPDGNRLRVVSPDAYATPSTSPSLTYVEGFTVTGFNTKTQNTDEFNETTAKIPSLWQNAHASGLAAASNLFAVYSDYQSDANGLYMVTVGVADEVQQGELNSVNIQPGNYLVFEGIGPMPSTVVDTWKKIREYFAEHHEHQRNFISDFEAYSNSDKVAIYIGIQ